MEAGLRIRSKGPHVTYIVYYDFYKTWNLIKFGWLDHRIIISFRSYLVICSRLRHWQVCGAPSHTQFFRSFFLCIFLVFRFLTPPLQNGRLQMRPIGFFSGSKTYYFLVPCIIIENLILKVISCQCVMWGEDLWYIKWDPSLDIMGRTAEIESLSNKQLAWRDTYYLGFYYLYA